MKKSTIFSIMALVLVVLIGLYLVSGYYMKKYYSVTKPVVTMEIEEYGIVKMELYPDMAPNTVKNFIKLINEGYYNGLTFHRVEEMLIQGGDTVGDGSGKSEKSIKGEFSANDYDNTLKFERGTLGLARADYSMYYYYTGQKQLIEEGYNSGYAQFFITTQEQENFDGNYAAFGKVIEGIEIVDTISKLETTTEKDEETGETSKTTMPIDPPKITKITVETFGENYDNVEVHETFDINEWFMNYYYQAQ